MTGLIVIAIIANDIWGKVALRDSMDLTTYMAWSVIMALMDAMDLMTFIAFMAFMALMVVIALIAWMAIVALI